MKWFTRPRWWEWGGVLHWCPGHHRVYRCQIRRGWCASPWVYHCDQCAVLVRWARANISPENLATLARLVRGGTVDE